MKMKKVITLLLIIYVNYTIARVFQDRSRIVGGKNAKITDAKYMASLRNPAPFCSAAIIHKRWVLTTAHCLEGKLEKDVQIVTGTVVYGDCRNSSGKSYDALKFKTFGDPSDSERVKDLALIQTSQEIDFNGNTNFIKLATDKDKLESTDFMKFFGWNGASRGGASKNILRSMLVTYLERKDCQAILKADDLEDHLDNEFCAIARKTNRLCVGDSGGVVVSRDLLFGMVAWPYSCMQVTSPYPDVYTDVREYASRIANAIGSDRKA